jgi:hypothetical protein
MIYVTILGLSLIGAFFTAWYLLHTSRVKERMLLIEKGYDPAQLPPPSQPIQLRIGSTWWKRIGILIFMTGLGILVPSLLFRYNIIHTSSDIGVSIVVIFAGVGFYLASRVNNTDKKASQSPASNSENDTLE